MGLTFFVSTSVSDMTTCGGFTVLGEMVNIEPDGTEKEITNVTCELEGQDDYPASIVYRG